MKFREQKLTLYNFEWQALRTSLNFSTAEKTAESIEKLKAYVHTKDADETQSRVYRALNLMCAVRMGISGSRKIAKSVLKLADIEKKDQLALEYRTTLSYAFHVATSLNLGFKIDSEAKMLYDLRKASKEDFDRVYCSLLTRWEGTGKPTTRNELGHYISLMNKVRKETYNERTV